MHKHKSNVIKFPNNKPKLQQDWEQIVSCNDCRANLDNEMGKLTDDEFIIFDVGSNKAIKVTIPEGKNIIVMNTSNSDNEHLTVKPQKL